MLEARKDVEAALRNSFIFPLLNPEEGDRFIRSAVPLVFSPGQAIVRMGDQGTSMLLVQAGEVRISRPSPGGRLVILNELTAGSVFGEIALLDGGPRSADATAITTCHLLSFERQALMSLLRDNWALTEALLRIVCERLRRSDDRAADLAFFDLPSRLAKELLARARSGPKGVARVSDTQQTLAGLVGASRETVNRCLRKWQRQGVIAIADGRISLIDPATLKREAQLDASA